MSNKAISLKEPSIDTRAVVFRSGPFGAIASVNVVADWDGDCVDGDIVGSVCYYVTDPRTGVTLSDWGLEWLKPCGDPHLHDFGDPDELFRTGSYGDPLTARWVPSA